MEYACSGVLSILGYPQPVASVRNATRGKKCMPAQHGTNRLRRAPA